MYFAKDVSPCPPLPPALYNLLLAVQDKITMVLLYHSCGRRKLSPLMDGGINAR